MIIDTKRDRLGCFELADGGTVFLNGIDEVSSALQTRLLRVLQEGVVEQVGDPRAVPVDVRVILATRKDLSQLVTYGLFSKDLFNRVNVVKISIPPLRDRRDDILPLVDSLIQRVNESGHEIEGLSPPVVEILMKHDYPHNFWELQNIIEHAAALCPSGVIRPEHLPDELIRPVCDSPERRDVVETLQRNLIMAALSRASGNRRAAAEALSIHPTTLWRRARRLGIELPETDGRSNPRRH